MDAVYFAYGLRKSQFFRVMMMSELLSQTLYYLCDNVSATAPALKVT